MSTNRAALNHLCHIVLLNYCFTSSDNIFFNLFFTAEVAVSFLYFQKLLRKEKRQRSKINNTHNTHSKL